MKIRYFSIFLLVFTLVSCNVWDSNISQEDTTPHLDHITAYFGDSSTKTSVSFATGDLSWSEGDQISMFLNEGTNGGVRYVSQSSGDITQFEGDAIDGSGVFYGVYPYSESASVSSGKVYFQIPPHQVATENNISDNTLVTVGKSSDKNMGFFHVTSGIIFTVTKPGFTSVELSSTEPVSGSSYATFDSNNKPIVDLSLLNSTTVTVSCPDGFVPGSYYFITFAPRTLQHGFTLKFSGSGNTVETSYSKYIVFERGKFGVINNADVQESISRIKSGKELSPGRQANCYIVSSPCDYKFPAKMGNSESYLGQMKSVEILWQTDNRNGTNPDILESVSCNSSYVFFSTPETLVPGSALIAAKDEADNIIWSWHIWVVPDYDPEQSAVQIGSKRILDRNLGALTNIPGDYRAEGFMYQWGRKDPFPGACTISSNSQASFSIHPVVLENQNSTVGTISYSIAHPNVFISANGQLTLDWLSPDSRDSKLWTTTKTIYDPCPPGWKVPSPSDFTSITSNYTLNNSYLGAYISNSWFPCVGYISASGNLSMVGHSGFYWSTGTDTMTSSMMEIDVYQYNRIYPNSSNKGRSIGAAVRCIAE